MPESIRIALSAHQQRMVAQWAEQQGRITADRNLFITTLLTSQYDPQEIATWGVECQADAIVLTPPAEAVDRELKLETG